MAHSQRTTTSLVREWISRHSTLDARGVLSSVRPIFVADDRKGYPELCASAVLFRASDTFFLLTAAHVLDWGDENTLYVGARSTLIEVQGEKFTSSTPAGFDRDHDKLDIGVVILPVDSIRPLRTECVFLNTSQVDVDERRVSGVVPGPFYLAIGFPASKARVKPEERMVRADPLVYVGRYVDSPTYEALGIAEHSHVAFSYDPKKTFSKDGKTTPPKPNGASGGGLWTFPTVERQSRVSSKLAGILIENRSRQHKVLVATRISLFLEAIRRKCPYLSDSIPRSTRVKVNVD